MQNVFTVVSFSLSDYCCENDIQMRESEVENVFRENLLFYVLSYWFDWTFQSCGHARSLFYTKCFQNWPLILKEKEVRKNVPGGTCVSQGEDSLCCKFQALELEGTLFNRE